MPASQSSLSFFFYFLFFFTFSFPFLPIFIPTTLPLSLLATPQPAAPLLAAPLPIDNLFQPHFSLSLYFPYIFLLSFSQIFWYEKLYPWLTQKSVHPFLLPAEWLMVVMPLNSIVILSTIVVWFQGGINGKKKIFILIYIITVLGLNSSLDLLSILFGLWFCWYLDCIFKLGLFS